MKFKEMNLEELKAYKAACEVYGTAADVIECEERIKELTARQ